jgi:hypothetical protein
MRLVFALVLIVGCNSDPASVIEAPNKNAPDYGSARQPEYTPCDQGTGCPAGQVCDSVNQLCVPAGRRSLPDAGSVAIPDAGKIQPDLKQPLTDTGPVDSKKPPPGPTKDDECTIAGSYQACPEEFWGCKLDPISRSLVCVEIEADNKLKSPCGDSGTCGGEYGCHYGVCCQYCELKQPACPTGKCTDLGHPVFGVCKPQ